MSTAREPPSSETDTEPRILLIESYERLAELVEWRLRVEGMASTKCANGRQALAALSSLQFDAVILDVDGEDPEPEPLLSAIRAQVAARRLPVLLLTSRRSTRSTRFHEIAIGASQTVTKPFTAHDLMRKLQLCLLDRRQGVAEERADTKTGGSGGGRRPESA
jgi:DNA-binding response OmpR family regulator